MKRLLSSFLLPLLVLAGCMDSARAGERKFRIIHNNDGTDLLSNCWWGRRPLTIEDANGCVDMIAGTGVTTYTMCVGSDFMVAESKFARVFGDDRGGTIDSSRDPAMKLYYQQFLNLKAQGADLAATVLNRAKSKGMEPLLTFRVNDLHFVNPANDSRMSRPDFWHEHPQYRMGPGERSLGWNAEGAMDFEYAEVREHRLNEIREQLLRYDMAEGIELDFMRFIVFFRSGRGRANAHLITDMVRRTRALCDSLAAVRGHDMVLAVRVPLTLGTCLDKGLDVPGWLREDLVDFITLGVHWRGDPAIDAGSFRSDLQSLVGDRALNIPIYATIDDGGFKEREYFSNGMMRGSADFAMSHGADGIMLFNYYLEPFNRARMEIAGRRFGKPVLEVTPAEAESVSDREAEAFLASQTVKGETFRERTRSLLRELSRPCKLGGRNLSYAWMASPQQYAVRSVTPLPASVPSEVALPLGSRKAFRGLREAVLVIRVTSGPVDVSIAGVPCRRLGDDVLDKYDRRFKPFPDETILAFEVPVSRLKSGADSVSISGKPGTLKRLDLIFNYGDVARKGWF